MQTDAEIASLAAAASAAQEFAFVSWDGSDGRRACPLATFGSRGPQTLSVRLACAEPPRADQPELKNVAELRGAVALVVRGGCSFAHKARLLQKAGAVAMLLANNTREEPLAAFTMGESPEELEQNEKSGAEPITMPCIMMCLRDVRELFQKFPPSVKTGVLTFEVLPTDEAAVVAEECLRVQRERHEATEAGKRSIAIHRNDWPRWKREGGEVC
ncbi:Transient receptor potential channel pyrexia [Phytophthora cinnamomi]|uniref:Transient receptor potential channel pyrexia n=1 Tax=Phytophthora cinnamomi TaxID=4785 RepID=UPI0035594A06|nr:Transient receptor potential channel pyrexia [Phytophthora cinnamomi]